MTIQERIARFSFSEPASGCIVWTGVTNRHGYGRIGVSDGGKRTIRLVSRLVWEIANGPIEGGQLCCHTCDNPACINIEHLFISDHIGNMADMRKKCKSRDGKPFGCLRRGNRFRSRVLIGGKRVYGGTFDSAAEAEAASRKLRDESMP